MYNDFGYNGLCMVHISIWSQSEISSEKFEDSGFARILQDGMYQTAIIF